MKTKEKFLKNSIEYKSGLASLAPWRLNMIE
jgi:hypothetical protein